MESTSSLGKRQNTTDNYYDGGWYYSDTGMAIRYSIIIAILFVILLYFVGGYFHARRRLKKGLPLMRYHRWMVRRANRQPRGNVYYQDPNQQGYPMQPYQNPPPPAYNNYTAPPPAYAPPEGASKAMADQNWSTNTQWGQTGEASQPAAPPAVARYN